ncbi:MAG: hypothetical protein Q8867_09735, partial [Bacteroidota bacterium]|nr:hypothetical protein [Bacteroidota bacterium]
MQTSYNLNFLKNKIKAPANPIIIPGTQMKSIVIKRIDSRIFSADVGGLEGGKILVPIDKPRKM